MKNDDMSISHLLLLCKAGDERATGELFQYYQKRLCSFAKKKIEPDLQKRVGASDVVQSALGSFFNRLKQDSFTISNSNALWQLLCAITVNKLHEQRRYHYRARRNIQNEQELTEIPIDQFSREEPSVEELTSFPSSFKT